MSRPCFFARKIPADGDCITLDEHESHHASVSRRLRAGDEVRLLDGEGVIADARIETATKKSLAARVLQRRRIKAPSPELQLASALPKGERQRFLLDMATQVGISQFVPLIATRSVARPRSGSIDRWRRICVEACKQSGNPFTPRIHDPLTPLETVRMWRDNGIVPLLADPDGAPFDTLDPAARVGILVGPEGGFTLQERAAMAEAGASRQCFGRYVMRIETAAVASLSILRARCATTGSNT